MYFFYSLQIDYYTFRLISNTVINKYIASFYSVKSDLFCSDILL